MRSVFMCLLLSLLHTGASQDVSEPGFHNMGLGVAEQADNVAAMASSPEALDNYLRQVELANGVDEDEDGEDDLSLFTYQQADEPTQKRFSEFLGGRRKKFSDLLDEKKRFSEFLGGKKRFSEFLGGKRKRFSEFLGGKKKRFSEFLGGKRSSAWQTKRFSEFLGGKRNNRDYYNGKRFSEFLGGK